MEMSLIDFSFAAMDNQTRGLDFSFITELKEALSHDFLQKGAEIAFASFPKSACKLEGKHWVPDAEPWALETAACETLADYDRTVGDFVCARMDLSARRAVRQLRLTLGQKVFLVTKMHHALCDGTSAFLWLESQLNHKPIAAGALQFKTHESPAKRSDYRFDKTPQRFGPRKAHPSPLREWKTFALDFSGQSFTGENFTYNDLLCAILFRSMREWNETKGIQQDRLGLYIPVNVRQNAREGFGNASSRVKIYDKTPSAPLADAASNVREQIKHCKASGLWHISPALPNLPKWLLSPLLKAYSKLPGTDMGSTVFSHIEKGFEDTFKHFKHIEIVAQLYEAYALAVTAMTLNGKTLITITWDGAELSQDDIQLFIDLIERNAVTVNRPDVTSTAL